MAFTRSGLGLLGLLLSLPAVSARPGRIVLSYQPRQAPAAYEHLGCFSDNVGGKRALTGRSYGDDNLTVQRCATFCATYEFFGLEYGRECYCGNSPRSDTSVEVAATDCSFPCAGDASQKCGAGDRLNIYKVATPAAGPGPATSLPGITSLGCFVDTGDRVLPSRIVGAADMTAAKCAANCAGYEFFGTQYGRECYCGTIAPTVSAPASECAMLCSGGDGSETCGGGMRLNVYHFAPSPVASSSTATDTAAATTVNPAGTATGPPSTTTTTSVPSSTATDPALGGYVYRGCYTDNIPQRVLAGRTFADGTMTPAKCAASCASGRYGWFGVEYGSECYCGTALDVGSLQRPDAECNMACSGDASAKCGAGNRLSVYANPQLLTSNISNPPTVGNFAYRSCWTDDTGNRSLKAVDWRTDDMTVDKCEARCRGYLYFGLEFARECYCGDELGGRAAPEGGCSLLCVGDTSQWCGGPVRLNLYSRATLSSSSSSSATSSTESPVTSTTDSISSTSSEATTTGVSTDSPSTTVTSTTEEPASTSPTSTVEPTSSAPSATEEPLSTSPTSTVESPSTSTLSSTEESALSSPTSTVEPLSTATSTTEEPTSTSLSSTVEPPSSATSTTEEPVLSSPTSTVEPTSTATSTTEEPVVTSPTSTAEPLSTTSTTEEPVVTSLTSTAEPLSTTSPTEEPVTTSPTASSTTEEPVTTSPTASSTTEEPVLTSHTSTVEPPSTTSTTEELASTSATSTAMSSTEEPVSTSATSTAISSTEEPASTSATSTTSSATEEPVSTTATSTAMSSTEEPVSTSATPTAISSTEEPALTSATSTAISSTEEPISTTATSTATSTTEESTPTSTYETVSSSSSDTTVTPSSIVTPTTSSSTSQASSSSDTIVTPSPTVTHSTSSSTGQASSSSSSSTSQASSSSATTVTPSPTVTPTTSSSTATSSSSSLPSSTVAPSSTTTPAPALTTVTYCPPTPTYVGTPEGCYHPTLPTPCERMTSPGVQFNSVSLSATLCKNYFTSYGMTLHPSASSCFPARVTANNAAVAASTLSSIYSCLKQPQASVMCSMATTCVTNTYTAGQVPSPTPSTGVNLLRNPGFEAGSLTNWTIVDTPGVQREPHLYIDVSAARSYTGGYASRWRFMNTNSTSSSITQLVRVEPGKPYRLRCAFWHESTTALTGLTMDAPPGYSSSNVDARTLTPFTWVVREATFTAMSSWIQVQIKFGGSTGGGPDTAYIDDVIIERLS